MKNKTLALFMCIFICFIIGMSSAFVILNSEHDCTGSHCHVCSEINMCMNVIKNIGKAVATAFVLILTAILNKLGIIRKTIQINNVVTLVSLKVKLSN